MWPTRWPTNTMSNLTDIDVRNAKEGEHTDGDRWLILVVRASRSGGKLRHVRGCSELLTVAVGVSWAWAFIPRSPSPKPA